MLFSTRALLDVSLVVHTVSRVLVSTHVASGALLGDAVSRPWLAAALGPLSHLALDAVPHWGRCDDRVFWRVAPVDGVVAASALVVLARRAWGSGSPRHWAAFAGAVTASMPDWDKPARLLAGFEPWPEPFNRLHRGIQRESPDWLTREVVVAVSSLALAAWRLRRRSA